MPWLNICQAHADHSSLVCKQHGTEGGIRESGYQTCPSYPTGEMRILRMRPIMRPINFPEAPERLCPATVRTIHQLPGLTLSMLLITGCIQACRLMYSNRFMDLCSCRLLRRHHFRARHVADVNCRGLRLESWTNLGLQCASHIIQSSFHALLWVLAVSYDCPC